MEILLALKGFIPALTILGVTQWVCDPEHMEELELEFIEMHKDENEFDHHIATGFNDEDVQFLLHLCAEALNLGEKPLPQTPEIQDVHIGFKKEVHLPFFVKVIRCGKKYAVIKAPQTDTAYLLKKGPPDPNIGDEQFYFHSKFRYGQIELTPEVIRSRIEACKSRKEINAEDDQGNQPSTPNNIESESSREYGFRRLLGNRDDGGATVQPRTKNDRVERKESETVDEETTKKNPPIFDQEHDERELSEAGARFDSKDEQPKSSQPGGSDERPENRGKV